MIKAKPASEVKQFAVVDVRDDDFVVGTASLEHRSNVTAEQRAGISYLP